MTYEGGTAGVRGVTRERGVTAVGGVGRMRHVATERGVGSVGGVSVEWGVSLERGVSRPLPRGQGAAHLLINGFGLLGGWGGGSPRPPPPEIRSLDSPGVPHHLDVYRLLPLPLLGQGGWGGPS